VDLPNAEERKESSQSTSSANEIFLALISINFSQGRRLLEQKSAGIDCSHVRSFCSDREFTQLDIIAAIKSTLPLSRTMTEQP